VGKTRLALAAAARQPLPVWLLRLDELSDPALLVPTLAQLLTLGTAAAASAQALGRALARETCLLLLDNAEHMLEPVAQLCTSLLAQSPGLRLLVTSQAPLRLGAEAVLPLQPLGLPPQAEDGEAPGDLDPEHYEATRLLTARIRHHTPGWEPGPLDAEALAALCRALDGLPLALELAAARVPLLGLAGVRKRLEQSLALLNRGLRDAASRHRSLEAALDWTFDQLGEGERLALQQLAVCAGTLGIDACEGLLGPEALDQVEELRARSLLVVEHAPSGLRLRLFETVRSHALQALRQAGRETEARLRHVRWLRQRFEGLWLTDITQAQESWQPQLATELDSLRGALHHALSPTAATALRREGLALAIACSPLWQRSGCLAEGWQWLQLARAQLDCLGAGDETLRQWLDLASVDYCVCTQQGDPREAAERLPALLTDAGVQGDPVMHFYAVRASFWLQVRLGFAPGGGGARAACDALRVVCQPHWPELAQRWCLRAEANVSRLAGDYEAALRWVQRHTELCRRHGALANARGLLLQPLQDLGLLGRWDEARRQALEQVAELQAAGLLRQYPFNCATASAIFLRSGPLGEQRAIVIQTLRLLSDARMLWWLADALPWAAFHAGRAADALSLQQWSDGLVLQRRERRGPFFGGMRQELLARLEAALGPLPALDEASLLLAAQMPEAEVLERALGPGTA